MRGLGAFQMAQMKHRDARVSAMAQHLRAAIDLWEDIQQCPFKKDESSDPPPPAPPPTVQIMPSEKLAYGIKEAAAAIGIGRTTLWRAIRDGKLPAAKLGNRTLIAKEALQAWLFAAQTRG